MYVPDAIEKSQVDELMKLSLFTDTEELVMSLLMLKKESRFGWPNNRIMIDFTRTVMPVSVDKKIRNRMANSILNWI